MDTSQGSLNCEDDWAGLLAKLDLDIFPHSNKKFIHMPLHRKFVVIHMYN